MRKLIWLALCLIVALISCDSGSDIVGCNTIDAPWRRDACNYDPDAPTPTAVTVTIPNVLHKDLRRAYRLLVSKGFKVEFSPKIGQDFRAYATFHSAKDIGMTITPAPHVAAIRPPRGTKVPPATTVVILDTECPNQAPTCM